MNTEELREELEIRRAIEADTARFQGMKNINVPLRKTVLKLRCLTAGLEGSHE